METGEEVSLEGFDKMIKDSTQAMDMLTKSVDSFVGELNKMQKIQVEKKLESMATILQRVDKAWSDTAGKIPRVSDETKQFVMSLTSTIEQLVRASSGSISWERILNQTQLQELAERVRRAIAGMNPKERVDFFREENTKSIKNMAKNIDNYSAKLDKAYAKEERLATLNKELATMDSGRLKPIVQANEYLLWQFETMEKIIALQRQAQGTRDVTALQSIMKDSQALQSQLDAIRKRLESIYKESPEAKKAMQSFFYGKESKMDTQGNITTELTQTAQKAKEINAEYAKSKKTLDQIEQRIESIKAQEAQRQARAQRTTQEEEKQLTLLERMAKLRSDVAKGDTNAISRYFSLGLSESKLNNAIAGLKKRQSEINISTREGQNEWRKVQAMIEVCNRELQKQQGLANRLQGAFSKVSGIVSNIAMSFGVMTGVFGLTQFVRSLYKITSEFQLQQRALAAIVNNTREANILFKQMQTLAVESPMKLMDLNKYAKQLAAFRIETRDLYSSLKMLGDISTGVGVSMDRLILAYGQVRAANYLRGQELRQFSEAGVNILGGLQEYYRVTKGINMSVNEIFDSVSKRKVLFEDVDAVLRKMTEQGGAFFNMQLIQSQTLYGQVQKLGDMWQIEMNQIGESHNGMLMGMVKTVQFVIKNLKGLITLFVTGFSTNYIVKFVRQLILARNASAELFAQMRKTRAEVNLLSVAGMKKFIANVKAAELSVQSLNLALSVGVAAAVWGISLLIRKTQEEKQRLQEVFQELQELNRRNVEIKELDTAFDNNEDGFRGQLALLEQLIEKAKEYGATLSLPADVNAENIVKVYKNATRQLKEYTRTVLAYRAAVLKDKDAEKSLKKFDELNADYAIAFNNAETLFNYWIENENKLTETEKAAFEELKEMREAYLKDEDQAMLEYGMDTDNWEMYFTRRMQVFRNGLVTKGTASQISSTTGAKTYEYETKIAENEFGKVLIALDNFVNEYEEKRKEAIDSTVDAFKKSNVSLKSIGKKTGEDLINSFRPKWEALKEALKEFGDMSKTEIAEIMSSLTDLPKEQVMKLAFIVENRPSNVDETISQRLLKKILGDEWAKNEEYDIDVNFNVSVNTEGGKEGDFAKTLLRNLGGTGGFKPDWSKAGVEEQGIEIPFSLPENADEYINKEMAKLMNKINPYDMIGSIFFGKNAEKSIDEQEKKLKKIYKELKEDYEQYQRATSFEEAEEQLKYGFGDKDKTLAGIKKYMREAKEAAKVFGWQLEKSTKGKGQSFKSEYQSMIDFIKKLNEEFEKLNKTFDSFDTNEWKGALNRVLDSFRDAFDVMPEDFKEEFGNAIENIDFKSKEATANSLKRLENLIMSSARLTAREKEEIVRSLYKTIGDIVDEVEVKLKIQADKRLYEQIDKMFADYELTVELRKLDINPNALADLFNINTTSLSQLYQQLEAAREKFQGEDAVNKYNEYVNKLIDINDKANLEMSKSYAKYIQKGYEERAKIEIEYMNKRAEALSLPLGDHAADVIDGLQKEMQKKLDELDWKQFQSSDFYIKMFEDLGNVSNQALSTMIAKLHQLKGTLSSLSPTELKAITEQMIKIEDELIKRNPFKMMRDSIEELKDMKASQEFKSIFDEFLGEDVTNNFKNNVEGAILEINEQMEKAIKERDELQTKLKAKEVIKTGKETEIFTGLDDVEEQIKELEKCRDEAAEAMRRLEDTATGPLTDDTQYTEARKEKVAAEDRLKVLNAVKQALITLGDDGSVSAEDLSKALGDVNNVIDDLGEKSDKLGEANRKLTEHQKSMIEGANQMKETLGEVKDMYDSLYEMLEDVGVSTDVLTDAWKEFGDTIFDTMTKALEMIPSLVTGFNAAGVAINSAMGIIGLIAEAASVIITMVSSVSKLHDAKYQKQIDSLKEKVDDLNDSAENLQNRFADLFDTDSIRVYNAKILEAKELTIEALQAMIDAEEEKKKKDKEAIKGWKKDIEDAQEEIDSQTESFYESLGGFGSLANMKSMAEEWTNAWYDAFKETGDGLSGLEESFDEFLDNLYKKQILNTLASRYFESLYRDLDSILAKEGGLEANRDEFAEWISRAQEVFGAFSADAEAYAQAMQSVAGTGAGLEGLTQSIQGMSEQTAEALAAYLNSIRIYVAENNDKLEQLRVSLCTPQSDNPIVSNLKIIAQQSTAIKNLFDSIITPSGSYSGTGPSIKVSL